MKPDAPNEIHLFVHLVNEQANAKLDQIIASLDLTLKKEEIIMATIQDVQAAVTAEDSVIDSVVALLTELTSMIAAIPTTDPATQAAIDAVVADVTAKTADLSAAVVANTPAA